MQINYSYIDIRKWLLHFRTLDYSKTKNCKDLIDRLIYKVVLYDDKMKILFHLKGGQKGELLLNLIFPDYPDGNGNESPVVEQSKIANATQSNEKGTDKSVSLSDVNARRAYTPVLSKDYKKDFWDFLACIDSAQSLLIFNIKSS